MSIELKIANSELAITQEGDEITDTCSGAVHVVGILFYFTAGL